MLRFSTNNDTAELKNIYNICFPGESDFCNRYFKYVYPKSKCIVFDNGGICGMAHLIDVEIAACEKVLKGAYLYAVATLPEFRGRGIAADIMNFAEKHCKENGYDFLCLIPQKSSLFEFYEKFGYVKGLYISKTQLSDFSADVSDSSVVSSRDCTEALKIYSSLPCCKLSRNTEDFLNIQRVYNTDFYYLTDGKKALGYCIGETDGDVFEVYEAVGSEQNIIALTTLIAKQNVCSNVIISSLPNIFSETVLGSVKPLTPPAKELFKTQKVYANLLFN